MANEVQAAPWLGMSLGLPTVYVRELRVQLRLQTMEHAIPGRYARDVFPDPAVAVQMRPMDRTAGEAVPVRVPRPLRLRHPVWAFSPDAQRFGFRIEMDFGDGWEDVSSDVVSPVKSDWGIRGTGPADRVAEPGTMSFDMDDSSSNAGGLRGYYSPDNPDHRPGFQLGTPVRQVLIHETWGEKVKWLGKIEHIAPRVGVASPTVAVSCADWLEEAALAPLSGLAVRTNIQSNFLFEDLVAAVPSAPPGGVFIKLPGSDRYPYALDQAQDESSTVIGQLQKLALSEYGCIYVDAGVATFEGRVWRGVPRPPVYELAVDDQILALPLTAHGREQALNRVQVTVHPRGVDAAPTAELFRLAAALQVKAGTTVTIQCQYRDPNQRAQRVGGVDMQTPTRAAGDYSFNAAQDGTGRDLTSFLTVSVVFGGNAATVTMTNGGGTDGYLPPGGLRLRGRGLYDFEPVLSDRRDDDSVDTYGENRLSYDMPFQDDPEVASELSRFLLHLHRVPRTRATSVTFLGNWDEEASYQAFFLAISDRIAITAPSAGLAAAEYFVNGIHFDLHQSGVLTITLDLVECDPSSYWQLGVPGKSELGLTTRLGYRMFKPLWWLGRAGYSELGRTTRLGRG